MLLYVLGAAFTIWMGVEAVRRGQANPWLWFILITGPIGAVVYFLAEYLPRAPVFHSPGGRRRPGKFEEHQAATEVRRLDNAEAWARYADVLRARNKPKEAAAAAEKAIDREADHPRALYTLGISLMESSRPEESLAPLQRLLELDPVFASGEGAYALAQATLATGNVSGARQLLEGLAGRSSRPQYLYALANLQMRDGAPEAARETLKRIIDEAEYLPQYMRASVRPWVRKARQTLKRLQTSASATS